MKIGGCQLLIQKVGEEFNKQGHHVYVLCNSVDASFRQVLTSKGMTIIKIKSWHSQKCINHIVNSYIHDKDELRVLTFIWSDFIWLSSTRFNRNTVKVLLYAVHYEALNHAVPMKGVLGAIHKSLLRPTISKLIKNNAIVVMDEQTIESTNRFYGFRGSIFDPGNWTIIRIPVDTNDSEIISKKVLSKYNSNTWNILAVARADFPFKGYLLGLIELFNQKVVPQKYELIIVSYGKDYPLLKAEYNRCDDSVRKKIHLMGKVQYSELKELFLLSHIYVGMGTTLLDASKYGVVSIPVVANTNKVLATSFFHDNYKAVALDIGTEERLIEMLNEYESIDSDKRMSMIKESQDIVFDYYSTESCASNLEAVFNSYSLYSNGLILFEYKFRRFINWFKWRLKSR